MSRFNKGWVKLWRSTIDSDISQNVYLWGIWHWLLQAAHWTPSIIIWNGARRDIPAGSVLFGIKELAERWDCSKTTIHKWLMYLQSSGRIAIETCSRGTLVTICNWETYQQIEELELSPRERQVDAARTPRERQVTLIEEVKKRRREERNNLAPFGDGASGFLNLEEAYQEYPRKRGKSQGMKIAQKQILTQESLSDLKQAIRNYAEECQRENRESKHILYFDSFMRQWRDWIHPENNPADEPFDISKVIERCEKRSRM